MSYWDVVETRTGKVMSNKRRNAGAVSPNADYIANTWFYLDDHSWITSDSVLFVCLASAMLVLRMFLVCYHSCVGHLPILAKARKTSQPIHRPMLEGLYSAVIHSSGDLQQRSNSKTTESTSAVCRT